VEQPSLETSLSSSRKVFFFQQVFKNFQTNLSSNLLA
jgi:hypothetical protein